MIQLDDYRVPGKKVLVKGSLELRTEDIAGETSGTDSIEKGIKPKFLRVSLSIAFKKESDLKSLIKKSETVNEAGERKIYAITNRTANATGIRQVKFTESFNWNEHDTLQQWDISFVLQEYLSNPERVEQRNGGIVSATDPTQFDQILKNAETNYLI